MYLFIAVIFLMYVRPGNTIHQNDNLTLIVEITDIRSDKGQLMISIYNDPETFPSENDMLVQKILPDIPGEVMSIHFKNLRAGTYAIAAMHDENKDEKLNLSLIGFPKEGYCFSNNVKPKLRRPKWEEAKFDINETTNRISIQMKY